ncbi:murein L,D-transpeptidase catalytic domain family protein [Sphingomonas sp.]|uniref:murein L,D-transpeptidase catalytic domain family protein n=1 Tax=Sphingomonas sp. TaxID=28214 RepID=UPI002CC55CAA|nr:murein L,D-transpeptidase catalytic domain family protein [Sphingomonas sp.]HWK36212.1 murein L,D-transpeptidase catalytic domain family protein [Sphingomonas sp.]
MSDAFERTPSRRAFVKTALVMGAAVVVPGCAQQAIRTAVAPPSPVPDPAAPPYVAPPPAEVAVRGGPPSIRKELFERAMAALDTHSGRIARRDRIAIVDFAAPSHLSRFHVVNVETGGTASYLVAHGIGSDPAHTGWLQRFSNEVNSEASCDGAFIASDYYVGVHGRSQRLIGLDPTNSNALDRAIVVHGAWYANRDMIATRGKLGRSQGCFAVGEAELAMVFDKLGDGRMIYAAKV